MGCRKCEDLTERLNRALEKLAKIREAETIEEAHRIAGRVVNLEVQQARHGHKSVIPKSKEMNHYG